MPADNGNDVPDNETILLYREVLSAYADTIKMGILWSSPSGEAAHPPTEMILPAFQIDLLSNKMISLPTETKHPYADMLSAYGDVVSLPTEMISPYADAIKMGGSAMK